MAYQYAQVVEQLILKYVHVYIFFGLYYCCALVNNCEAKEEVCGKGWGGGGRNDLPLTVSTTPLLLLIGRGYVHIYSSVQWMPT